MKITWIGHSCFKIEQDGYSVVTDPYNPESVPGYHWADVSAHMVLCSHDHGDHNYSDGVKIQKTDLTAPYITEISNWHDEVKGAKRGPNMMRIIDFGKEKIAHLGDIGCDLSEDQISALQDMDVLLIPVGGFYTIDGKQAAEITRQLHPRMVIPMHFRDDHNHFGYDEIGPVDAYLSAMGQDIIKAGSIIDTADYLTAEEKTQIILMSPANI